MDNFDYEEYNKNRISWKDFLAKNDFSLRALVKFNNTRVLNKGFFKDLTFMYRVIMNKKVFYAFLDQLKEPLFFPLAEIDDAILLKILRPYELSRYTIQERVKAITDHYKLLSQYLTSDQINQIYSNDGLEIGKYTPTEAIPLEYKIVIHYSKTHRREGELTVSIVKKTAIDGINVPAYERIFSVALNLGTINNEKVMKINSIQGCTPHLQDPQKEISNITKLGFGLLPKYLLLTIAFNLAKIFEINKVLGIKKDSHVFNNKHYKSKMQNEFKNDYDKHWMDFGATEFDNDYYELHEQPRTPIEEIPSKKRSQHRKRYAFVDQLLANLNQKFVKK